MAKTEAYLPIDDIKRFERKMRRLPEDIRPGVLSDMGEALVGEAQVDSPIDKGILADSHYVSDYEDEAVVIGANTDYALAVHETHPTKAHWFINAINRNFRRISREAIRKALRDRGAS